MINIKPITEFLFKILFKFGATSNFNSNAGCFSIITFHRVLPGKLRKDYPLPWLVTTPRELHLILYQLKKEFELGTVSDLLKVWRRGGNTSKPLMAITFDDGFKDNYVFAAPVLEKLGLNGTFYIPAGIVEEGGIPWDEMLGFAIFNGYQKGTANSCIIDCLNIDILNYSSPVDAAKSIIHKCKSLPTKDRLYIVNRCSEKSCIPDWSKMMSWEHLKKLVKNGHEIGSHSMTHSILTNCSDRELQTEILESKKKIESTIDAPVLSFCYPSGAYDMRIQDYTEIAGYKSAVTTEFRLNKKYDSLHKLGRFDINTRKLINQHGIMSPYRLAWHFSAFKRIIYPTAKNWYQNFSIDK